MANTATDIKLAHPFLPVKSTISNSPVSPQKPVRHHSSAFPKVIKGNRNIVWRETGYYGVSSDFKILTKGVFNKRFDQIVHCLRDVVALPTCQREAVLRLLRIWAYYGKVYPKASQVAAEPGCSKATFWRAVSHLKKLGLIRVIPRILDPLRRQISDLFILHNLIILIARYLAEHGVRFWDKWLKPYLELPGRVFWAQIFSTPEGRAGPS